jgi:hypothetical protein
MCGAKKDGERRRQKKFVRHVQKMEYTMHDSTEVKFDEYSSYTVELDGSALAKYKRETLLAQGRNFKLHCESQACYAVFEPARHKNPCKEIFLEMEKIRNPLASGGFIRRDYKKPTEAWTPYTFPDHPVIPRYTTTSSSEQKGNKMNIQTLLNLANNTANKDDLSQYDELPEGLKEAMVELAAEQKKSDMKAAAAEILGLLSSAKKKIEAEVFLIRNLRRQVEESKTRIEELERAKAYAEATSNFVPLASMFSPLMLRSDQEDLSKIPADFKVVKKA